MAYKWQKEFNPDIKPLETSWRGFLFRSRLEARWGVFFAALHIAFHYEPQGFELPDGTLYLPDFYLPQVDMWAEVKPAVLTPIERTKCEHLVEASDKECLLLIGPPEFKPVDAIVTYDPGENNYVLDVGRYSDYYRDEHRFFSGADDRDFCTEANFSDAYRDAVYAARQERFQGGR